MAVNCGVSFGVCAIRATKLDSTGFVAAGPDNNYVSDKIVTITLTPNIEEGNTFSLRNGCGCSIARFRGNNVFNWFDFSISKGALEPELEAMLLGGTKIVDGADDVGVLFPGALDCSEDEPAVAFEFWTKHIVESAQDATHPWVHWVFPRTIWSLSDNTFEEELGQVALNGFSRTNEMWGDGPYGEGAPDGQNVTEGGYWKTAVAPPTDVCGAGTVTPAS